MAFLEEVLAFLHALIGEVAVTEEQHVLMEAILGGVGAQLHDVDRAHGWVPCIDLPAGVHSALSGDAPPVALGAACTLVFGGMDVLDDLADGDRRPWWQGYTRGEIEVAAITWLQPLPILVISRMKAPPARRVAMQRTLAEGMVRMGAGQQRDLALTGRTDVSAAAVEASVVGKSGEQLATYAALAALTAGAPQQEVTRYQAFGLALGTAIQLSSDCRELFDDPACRDLAQGTRTLPIALHLERLHGTERADFLALLERARADPDARQAVRGRLRAAGELRRVAFLVEVYLQRARRLLGRTGADRLHTMIESLSFFTPRNRAHDLVTEEEQA